MSRIKTLDNIIKPMVSVQEAALFLFNESVEEYEQKKAKNIEPVNLSTLIVAMEGFRDRLRILMEAIITEINSEIDSIVACAVYIRDKSRSGENFVLDDPNIVRTSTQEANKEEQNFKRNVYTPFESQIGRVEKLIERAKAL